MPEPIRLSPEDLAGATFLDDRPQQRPVKLSQEDLAGATFLDGDPTGDDPDVQPGAVGRYVDVQTGEVVNGRKLHDGRTILAGSETTDGKAALLDDRRFKLVPKRKIGAGEAFGRQAIQGLTLGFADEVGAAVGSAFSEKPRKQILGEIREGDREAIEQQTMASIAGGVIGSGVSGALPGLKAPPGAGLLARGVRSGLTGAAAGVGHGNVRHLDEALDAALMGGALGAGVEVAGGALMRNLTGQATARAEKAVQSSILRDADQKAARALAGETGEGTVKAGKFVLNEPSLRKTIGNPKQFGAAVEKLSQEANKGLDVVYDAADAAGSTVSGQGLIERMGASLRKAEREFQPGIAAALRKVINGRRQQLTARAADVEMSAADLDDVMAGVAKDYAEEHPKIAAKSLQFQLGELKDELAQSVQAGRKVTLAELDGAIGEVLKRGKKLPRAFREEIEEALGDVIGRAAEKKGAYQLSYKEARDFVRGVQSDAFEGGDGWGPVSSAVKRAARAMSMEARGYLNDQVAGLAQKGVIPADAAKIRALNDRMSMLIKLERTTAGQLRRAEGITQTAPTSISDLKHGAKSLAVPLAAAAIDPTLGVATLGAQQAIKRAPAVARKVNIALSRLVQAARAGNATAQAVQLAIEEGVPRAVALRVVQSFGTPSQDDTQP